MPRVRWMLGEEDVTNLSTKRLINFSKRLYNYTIKLIPLKPDDCGKELTYEIIGYSSNKISGKTTIRVLCK